ncbi:MAG: glycosyltransferase family 52 [bacterium]|nr:glycosyltransferase family 52 [bacterium]
MRFLYICHTVYHLMMTIARMNRVDRNSVCLVDTIADAEEFAKRLERTEYFEFIRVLRAADFDIDGEYPEDFKTKNSDFFKKFDKIGVYNDDTYISHFLYQQGLRYTLFEDGYNYFQFPFDYLSHYNWWSRQRPNYKYSLVRGHSETCDRIEINSFDGVEKDDRYEKMVEVPQAEIFSRIDNEKLNILSTVFPFDRVRIKNNSTLILTQPLFMDGIMKTEEEQKQYFYKLCKENSKFFKSVYFKPHPRDNIDYPHMKRVYLLPKNIPLEVMALLNENFRFKKGITHSSTAMDFADFIDEKIILEDLKNV